MTLLCIVSLTTPVTDKVLTHNSHRTTPADKMEMQKEEFVVWVRQAMAEKKSIAYQEMYHFLTQCFVRADKQMTGRVSKYNFDSLVEEAAVLPRKYGFAPKSSDMFPNEEARKKAREAQFDAIDTHKQGWVHQSSLSDLKSDLNRISSNLTAFSTKFWANLPKSASNPIPNPSDLTNEPSTGLHLARGLDQVGDQPHHG